MNLKKILPASVAGAGLLASAAALADIQITVNNASGSVGGNVVVSYDYAALNADDVSGIQFDLLYDPAVLTPVDISTCGANRPATHTAVCTEPGGAGNGTVRTIIVDITPPSDEILPVNIPSMGQFTFQILQPGTHQLTFSNAAAGDVTGATVVITGNNATITGAITGAAGFSSSPPPGSTLALGSGVVGSLSANSPQTITVSEIGDQQLDVTAITFTGTNASAFSSPTAPFSIPDGGDDVDVAINCTPDARGNLTATVELTNNSVNSPNPQYNLTCAGLSPNVQVPAGPINLAALTTDPAPTGNITVTNPQDGFTSAATNVTATAGAGDAQITVTTGGPATINPDGSFNFVVSCDNSAAGSFSRTINITWDNPAFAGGQGSDSIVVNCQITDAIPSFTSTPAAPGPLNFGIVTNGTTSAPIGINVGNDGVGPAPNSNLTISSVVSSNPQFTVNVSNTGPFPVGAPSGPADIEVSCAPTSVGPITGTITVNHNGDDSPTVFNATCEGQSDAQFSSDPAPGGVLNLGVVPPSTTTPVGFIDFSNGGNVNSLGVSCTVDDPAGVFTFSPDPISLTIGPGATVSVGFQCTPSAPDSFTATVSCQIEGDPDQSTAQYSVICQGQPLVVPTMNRWGLVIMSLVLLLVAGVVGRRMMA